MSDFTEIVPPNLEDQFTPTEDSCPKCGNRLYHGQVSCPGSRYGCLVLHYGYRCLKCGGQYERS